MACLSSNSSAWFEAGIFKWFEFVEEVKVHFTIDKKASLMVQKSQKTKLSTQKVLGKGKTCNWESSVHYGNPSNWVRHLKLVTKLQNSYP